MPVYMSFADFKPAPGSSDKQELLYASNSPSPLAAWKQTDQLARKEQPRSLLTAVQTVPLTLDVTADRLSEGTFKSVAAVKAKLQDGQTRSLQGLMDKSTIEQESAGLFLSKRTNSLPNIPSDTAPATPSPLRRSTLPPSEEGIANFLNSKSAR